MTMTRCGREMTPRIQKLKDEFFQTPFGCCFERAWALTRSYQKTEGESVALRRAKGFYEILTTVPLYLRPNELLVGSRSSGLAKRTTYPEYTLASNRDWPEEIEGYWRGKTVLEASREVFTDAIRDNDAEMTCGYVTGTGTGFGHLIVDYEKAIRRGFRAIIEEAEAGLPAAETQKERDFLQSVIITSQAIIAWANRYADLAEAEAATAEPARAKELLEIVRICRKVPEYPAETFHEALQAFVFTHLAVHIEQYGWSISAGRFDQYIYPFYARDLEEGRMTEDEAWELLLSLWMKFMENVHDGIGATLFQNFTIGGQDADGNDMSNPLSHLCLDAIAATRFIQPAVTLRWHQNIDPDLWAHAMEVIAQGMGMPALFHDDVIMAELEANGVSHEDALNYAIVGCVEPAVPGKEQAMTAGGHLNPTKVLELTLTNGKSLTTGKQLGIETGDPTTFSNFEEFFAAYTKQMQYIAGLNLQAAQIASESQMRLVPCPFTSSLLDNCIARRKDMVDGGTKYSLSGVCIIGATNAVDGMMNIKRLVYEKKRYTMQQVITALQENFENDEIMRQVMLHQPDRFGNDVQEADEMANRVYAVHAEFNSMHADSRGGHYTSGVWPVNTHVASGHHTGASPDGRKSGTPLVDGVGAVQGIDVHGPTALLRSVASLNNVEHWAGGNTCNIKFSASAVRTENALENMGRLAETFMRLGGQELQINVVDNATLLDAQEHPENYQDLVVRVAGYSAYFTRLSRDVQNEVISRNTQDV
ncbi:MAG: glycyl radical protein [Ruminococcaceae bacterium]|nr:glycyl radical protein [Oscillospiraceae bacterium]